MILINGIVYGETYNNGEFSHICDSSIVAGEDRAVVDWKYEGDADFMLIGTLKELLASVPEKVLHICRMPYMMQKKGYMLTYFNALVDIINSVGFDKVVVFDPDNIDKLIGIRNLQLADMSYVMRDIYEEYDFDMLVFTSPAQSAKYAKLGINNKALVDEGQELKCIINAYNPNTGEDKFICKPHGVKGSKALIVTSEIVKGKGIAVIADRLKKMGVEEIGIFATTVLPEAETLNYITDSRFSWLFTMTAEDDVDLDLPVRTLSRIWEG